MSGMPSDASEPNRPVGTQCNIAHPGPGGAGALTNMNCGCRSGMPTTILEHLRRSPRHYGGDPRRFRGFFFRPAATSLGQTPERHAPADLGCCKASILRRTRKDVHGVSRPLPSKSCAYLPGLMPAKMSTDSGNFLRQTSSTLFNLSRGRHPPSRPCMRDKIRPMPIASFAHKPLHL